MKHILAPWALFACDHYYPMGGSRDIFARFARCGKALAAYPSLPVDPEDRPYNNIGVPPIYDNYDQVSLERLDIHPLYANPSSFIILKGDWVMPEAIIRQSQASNTLPNIYPIYAEGNKCNILYKYKHVLPSEWGMELTYTATYGITPGPDITTSIMTRQGNIQAELVSANNIQKVHVPDGDLSVIRDALRTALQAHPGLSPEQRTLYTESIDTLISDDISERLEASFILD